LRLRPGLGTLIEGQFCLDESVGGQRGRPPLRYGVLAACGDYVGPAMKIESVDFFYLSMPEVHDIGDGSQHACLVRVRAGGVPGWGECEAAPLPSIAAFVCPMSHRACKPVQASVLGRPIDDVADIRRIGDLVRDQSLDLLQADHTLSGIDMALWDLL